MQCNNMLLIFQFCIFDYQDKNQEIKLLFDNNFDFLLNLKHLIVQYLFEML